MRRKNEEYSEHEARRMSHYRVEPRCRNIDHLVQRRQQQHAGGFALLGHFDRSGPDFVLQLRGSTELCPRRGGIA